MENLTEEERRLIVPMMKNYIEKYTSAGDFEKAKARVLVRCDLQKMIGETQGPVSRTESIFIRVYAIASYVSRITYVMRGTDLNSKSCMRFRLPHTYLTLCVGCRIQHRCPSALIILV